jgi:hypothetical protein
MSIMIELSRSVYTPKDELHSFRIERRTRVPTWRCTEMAVIAKTILRPCHNEVRRLTSGLAAHALEPQNFSAFLKQFYFVLDTLVWQVWSLQGEHQHDLDEVTAVRTRLCSRAVETSVEMKISV